MCLLSVPTILWPQWLLLHHQGKAKRRKKGGRQKGWKTYRSEVKEARKVLSLLQSSRGHHHDIQFHQLLCPEPSCEECNNATAEVNQLLFPEDLEDATPLASIVSGLSQSTNPTDSLACQHIPPMLSTSPLPDCPSTVIQLKSIFPSLKPVPEDLSPDSPGGLSTHQPIIRDTDNSNLSISDNSCWQAYAKNMFLPTLSCSDFQQEHGFLHLPETGLWGDSVSKHMEASSHSFLGLNVQALLERQIKKRKALQILEKEENKQGPFSKQIWSEYQQSSLGNSLQLLDVQNIIVPQTGWNIEDKPEQLHNSQALFYAKTLEENLQQKYSQLFWGLPSLHSESLVATFLVSSSSSPLETRFVLFNGICNASIIKMQHQGSPPFPHFHFLPLNVDPQHLPQIKPQTQYFTQVQPQLQPQPHFQSQLAILPSSSSSQIRDCGVSFNRSQNESDSNILDENQHLECHILQKQQESLQGLVPILQNAQDNTCPQAPNLPLVSQSSHAYVPVSILPGHFHTTNEPQGQLQLYAPSRVIPFQCHHACRNLEPLELTVPQCKLTETPLQKDRHAHLQLSELQGECSKSLGKNELCFPGRLCEGVPQNFQLREDIKRNLGYILEKSPEDSPQRISECYLVKRLRAASETKSNCACHPSHLGNKLLSVSRNGINQNKIKAILRLHLSKKSSQITEGRIPIGVCHSWMAEDNTWPPSGNSYTNKKITNSKNTMTGRVFCQITTQELSFLDPNTRQMLEAHIIRFQMNQRWGLPLKVLQSIKFYTAREGKTWPLPQFGGTSSAIHISNVVSEAEVFKPLEGNSKAFQGNKLRINSVGILEYPLPAFPYVSWEGPGVLKTSHAGMEHKLAENVQKTVCGRQTFQPLMHHIIDQGRQSETVLNNRYSPKVPRKLAGAGHEPRDETVSSHYRAKLIQGQKTMAENLKYFPISKMFSEILKAQEPCAIKSQPCDILATQELGVSQMINLNMSKEESPLTTECPSPKILNPPNSKLSNLQKQLLAELKLKLKSREQNRTQGCPTDMSLTSDSFPSLASPTLPQSISSGHMGAYEGPHVYFEDSTELKQESWVPKNVLQKCQDINLPPAAKKVRTLDSKVEEWRSEDSSVWTSKARKKSHPVEDRELEGTFLSLSQNEQFPPDSYFKKKRREFTQWINSKRKSKELETCQQKTNFMPTLAQEHDLAESATIFLDCGLPEAHELMTAIGKILEEKVANNHELQAFHLSQQK
ncbi:spermatogenesis-associated protein 31D1-like isoform X2 [Eptesicus fuscus]|uniref:spermatogenesis-associated protein 31D1-like isoform X2 n=1 Tax=Eptesicus fuscus TaxID=29078 RepID=UPI002403B6AD|nr:spermatogenesis-associated protein 31D1-like isoform X2 [Eptesicus fuscus]